MTLFTAAGSVTASFQGAQPGVIAAIALMAGAVVATGWLFIHLRRKPIRASTQLTPANAPSDVPSPDDHHPGTPSASGDELDLQLLRFLGKETPEGFCREIDRYIAVFDADRCRAHTLTGGDAKSIHRMAHTLLSHARIVNCQPLAELATQMQTEAAVLDSAALKQNLQQIDREFALLRNKLETIRASTARA